MKFAIAILLSCMAGLAVAHPVFNTTACGDALGTVCPELPSVVSCASGRCYVATDVSSVAQFFSINEADIPNYNNVWASHQRTTTVPQFITSIYASKTSSAVFAAGSHPGAPSDNSVLYSAAPNSEPFAPVVNTPGPIVSIAPLPGADNRLGAFYVRKDGTTVEAGIHVISSTGTHVKTIAFDTLGPFTPTSISFAGASMWFMTAYLTEKDSVVLRSDDNGATWGAVHALFNDDSRLNRISCTQTTCSVVAYGGLKSYVYFGRIQPTITWETRNLPTGSRRYLIRGVGASEDGRKLMIAGIYPDQQHVARAYAFYVTRKGVDNIDIVPMNSPLAGVFADATFSANDRGVMVGYGNGDYPIKQGVYTVFHEE